MKRQHSSQGLLYDASSEVFIESCGEYNRSMIQIYSLEKHKVYSKQRIPGEFFGNNHF